MSAGSELRSVERTTFGSLPDGTRVECFVLRNASDVEVSFLDLGGIIRCIRVPDRRGVLADVTPGYDTLDAYLHDVHFFGALVGRVANRIAGGRLAVDGREYRLPLNDGPNHLHGGPSGFHRVHWTVTPFTRAAASGATLTHTSVDGAGGYPGTLEVRITYTLTDDNELWFEYEASTDRATPVNLTQHTYFNLAGHDAGDVLDHELTLRASRFIPVNAERIPTGELRAVRNTAFDFTSARVIGTSISDADDQLQIGGGYDHNWVIDARTSPPQPAARLVDPRSGRTLEIETTEPGIQFYSGNGLSGGRPGKEGHVYGPRAALALETQHFPDAPNHPGFASIILRPGDRYRSRTVYRFGVEGGART